jgi:predicted secreted protein with PEFG-CTERM motif
MKSKSIFTLFGIISLVTTLSFVPTVFGQYNDQSDNSGAVHLGNMGVTSVGNMPVMSMMKATTTDGSEQVIVTYSPNPPTSGQPLSITLTFTNAQGNPIQHQNYAISVIQDGNEVYSNIAGHTHTGNDMQTTDNLPSSNPVDIKITLNGIGLPGTDPSTWTGVKGEVLVFHGAAQNTVPEFGPIAGMIITISIISVVAITKKSRFSF